MHHICSVSYHSNTQRRRHTRVANTSVVDLDADLVRFWRGNLNVLNGQVLAGLPGHGGLAGDGLQMQRDELAGVARPMVQCIRALARPAGPVRLAVSQSPALLEEAP